MAPQAITLESPVRFEREIVNRPSASARGRAAKEWKRAIRRAGIREWKLVPQGNSISLYARLTVRQAFAIGEHEARIAEQFGASPAVRERLESLLLSFLSDLRQAGANRRAPATRTG